MKCVESLTRHWYRNQKQAWAVFLLPLSLLYRLAMSFRRQLYRFGLLKTKKFPVPVIVVGNLTVGGNGKTPIVANLVHELKARGYRPGIVSRGYGGKANHYPQSVGVNSDPKKVGDEPVLLALQSEVPIVVDPKRTRAVKTLLSTSDCNVIISDDGLQHYAMGRSIEIVVVDGQRRFGNEQCLPSGPLREPLSRLNSVDFVLVSEAAEVEFDTKSKEYYWRLNPQCWMSVGNHKEQSLHHFAGQRVHAVAGIAHPERFFEMLQQLGCEVIRHSFPDHHAFSKQDLQFNDQLPIVMTEKDAVKCKDFTPPNAWFLRVTAKLPNEFLDALQKRINTPT